MSLSSIGLLCNVAMIHVSNAGSARPRLPTSTGDLLGEKLDIDFDQHSSCSGRQRLMARFNTCNGCETRNFKRFYLSNDHFHMYVSQKMKMFTFCFLVVGFLVCFLCICNLSAQPFQGSWFCALVYKLYTLQSAATVDTRVIAT